MGKSMREHRISAGVNVSNESYNWQRKSKPIETESYLKRDSKGKKQWIKEFKMSLGCKVCGMSKSPRMLTFHHRDPSLKDYRLKNGTSWGNLPFKTIKDESRKCDVLCISCHQDHHANDVN